MSQTNSVKLSSFGLINTNNIIVTELGPRKPELIKTPAIVWSYIGVKHAQLSCIQPTQPSWLGQWSKWCGMLDDQGPTKKNMLDSHDCRLRLKPHIFVDHTRFLLPQLP